MEENHLLPESDRFNLTLLAVIWILMVIVINPIGNFPLNDDWAFGASVQALVERGYLKPPDWAAPNFIAQLFWGSLFSYPFGFSYTALRFSSLTLGLIGVLLTYKSLREMNVCKEYALVCAMLVMVNPLYFGLSNTFMTDVPFSVCISLTILYAIRAVRDGRFTTIVFLCTAAGLSQLIRQIGLVVPVGFACSYLFCHRLSVRNFFKAIMPLAVCVLLQIIYEWWLHASGRLPSNYGVLNRDVQQVFASPMPVIAKIYLPNLATAMLYLAIFLAPVLIIILVDMWERGERGKLIKGWVLYFLATILTVIFLRWLDVPLPPELGNIIRDFGIGPPLKSNASLTEHLSYLKLFWQLVGLASIGFGVLLVRISAEVCKRILLSLRTGQCNDTKIRVMFFIAAVAYSIPVFALDMVDRYFLPLLLFTLHGICGLLPELSLAGVRNKVSLVMVSLVILGTGFFSVAVTHDYLAWNRTRWHALNDLMTLEGVPPERINGGFEFNGRYLYAKGQDVPNARGWWVVDDEYLVAFTEFEGYKPQMTLDAGAWLPFSPQTVFVLHRQ